ncbi:MAG: hypothetical protein H7A23_01765 [Leptospiraceae bacterium]|nr:hypothetical protein [Leptospiraceae bacterium]MCP5493260.1 hypothetical protein [Leptospiraceae bacterium]
MVKYNKNIFCIFLLIFISFNTIEAESLENTKQENNILKTIKRTFTFTNRESERNNAKKVIFEWKAFGKFFHFVTFNKIKKQKKVKTKRILYPPLKSNIIVKVNDKIYIKAIGTNNEIKIINTKDKEIYKPIIRNYIQYQSVSKKIQKSIKSYQSVLKEIETVIKENQNLVNKKISTEIHFMEKSIKSYQGIIKAHQIIVSKKTNTEVKNARSSQSLSKKIQSSIVANQSIVSKKINAEINNTRSSQSVSKKIQRSIKSYQSILKEIENIIKESERSLSKNMNTCFVKLIDLFNNGWSQKTKSEKKTSSNNPAIYEKLSFCDPAICEKLFIPLNFLLNDIFKELVKSRPPSIVISSCKRYLIREVV